MAATPTDIARLRRMVDEPTTTTYSDLLLASYLEAWPLTDKNGLNVDDGASWIEAYDLHAAAADIWEEKAGAYASKHDFQADGASYSSSQMYQNAMNAAKRHRAEQKAISKKAAVKKSYPVTYYPDYVNPIFDEDEEPDWLDSIV